MKEKILLAGVLALATIGIESSAQSGWANSYSNQDCNSNRKIENPNLLIVDAVIPQKDSIWTNPAQLKHKKKFSKNLL